MMLALRGIVQYEQGARPLIGMGVRFCLERDTSSQTSKVPPERQ